MAVAQDWLPPGAACGGLLRPALQSALEAWSAHWFAARALSVGRIAERGAAGEGWRHRGHRTATRTPKPSMAKLMEAALDLRLAAGTLTDRDRDLLDRLTEAVIEDLCNRVEAALEIDETDVLDDQNHEWLEVSVAEGVGPDLFWLALPIPVLARACRKAAGRPSRLQPLAPLRTPLAEVPVLLEATIGHVEVSMPDLAALQPGDILVLSTPIDQPVEVSLQGSSHVLARARLADEDGELALAFQTNP
jgi:flagellar motor switch/type III secretory pathway protein FliN